MERKIGMVSLGCPKNQIDAEHILADLKGKGTPLLPRRRTAM